MTKFHDDIVDVAQRIGLFYLKKNNHDYKATERELEQLRIQEITFDGPQELRIKLSRPGLLIGRKGANIDALAIHLGINIAIEETESIYDWIVPRDYSEFMHDIEPSNEIPR